MDIIEDPHCITQRIETEGEVHVQVECDCKLRQGINGMFICKGTDGNPDMCINKAGKLYAPGAKLPRDDKVRAHFAILVCRATGFRQMSDLPGG